MLQSQSRQSCREISGTRDGQADTRTAKCGGVVVRIGKRKGISF
jgi:hypothetical protein